MVFFTYSQVAFILKFHSKTFFWKKKKKKLKFSRLTEIWCRGTLLYLFFEFIVCFFKIFVLHIFWANLVPKSEVGTEAQCYMLVAFLSFIFSKFFSFIFFGTNFVPKSEVLQINENFVQGYIAISLLRF